MSQDNTATNGTTRPKPRVASAAITGPAEPSTDNHPIPLAEIEAAVRSIRYGSVQIIIQDGLVLQIDRTEKRRIR